MKYSKQILSCMLAMGLLSACSANTEEDVSNVDDSAAKTDQSEADKQTVETTHTDDDTKQVQTSEADQPTEQTANSKDNHSTEAIEDEQSEILSAIKKELKTDLPVKLPTLVPLEDGKYVTATTKVDKNKYIVTFYEMDKQVKVNDPSLNKASKKSMIAKFKVVNYSNVKKANEVISFEDFSKVGGQKMNLGHNIIGYQDAGAGSLWTSWNEGRWALATHTEMTKPDLGLALAKQAVEFLETNTLPTPKPNGSIRLDAISSTENNVKWQNDNIVFSVEKVKDPIDALKMATSVK